MRTADRLVDCAMWDRMPETPTCADFGIKNSAIFGEYQRAIRQGKVTADQLNDAILSDAPGAALTKMIGIPIKTVYDM